MFFTRSLAVVLLTVVSMYGQPTEGCITRHIGRVPISLYYKLHGSHNKNTVILVHDFATNSNVWHCTAKYLAKKFRVLLVDLRGHGRSSIPLSGYSYEDFADDINCVATRLGIRKAHFVGWGLGGTIGQCYATKYKRETCSLVLLASTSQFISGEGYPFGLPVDQANHIFELLRTNPDAFVRIWTSLTFTERCDVNRIRKSFADLLQTNNFDTLFTIAREDAGTGSKINNLSNIQVPTLIIAGGLDAINPAGASNFMSAFIPDSQVETLPCNGHAPHLTNVSAVNYLIKKFLCNPKDRECQPCSCDPCPTLCTELNNVCGTTSRRSF